MRLLAVEQDENRWPDLYGGAPTLNEALGTDIQPNQSRYGVFVKRNCFEDYPERYQVLQDALLDSMEDPAYRELLEELGELDSLDVYDAAQFHDENLEQMNEIAQTLEQFPERFDS